MGAAIVVRIPLRDLLRVALRALGCRYRSNVKRLPGCPTDPVEHRFAVFCDGDFWHGRNWERKAKTFVGLECEYWVAKIGRNRSVMHDRSTLPQPRLERREGVGVRRAARCRSSRSKNLRPARASANNGLGPATKAPESDTPFMSDSIDTRHRHNNPVWPGFHPHNTGKELGEDLVLHGYSKLSQSDGDPFRRGGCGQCWLDVKPTKGSARHGQSRCDGDAGVRLITVDDEGALSLTAAGESLRDAPDSERDLRFAQHIITMCEGQRFIEAIQRYELRGQVPDMEDLSIEFGESATSKNISTLRAWLARAGVVWPRSIVSATNGGTSPWRRRFSVRTGLDRIALEFLIAARFSSSTRVRTTTRCRRSRI